MRRLLIVLALFGILALAVSQPAQARRWYAYYPTYAPAVYAGYTPYAAYYGGYPAYTTYYPGYVYSYPAYTSYYYPGYYYGW